MSSRTPRPTSLSLACSMPSLERPLESTARGMMPVVHLVVIEDVPQRIPVRRRLDRHVERIVGVEQAVLPPGQRIGAGGEHGVDWVPALAEQAALRSASCPSGIPSAKTLPRLMSLAAATTSAGVTWLSVPIWSSLPQRPQLDSALKASSTACLETAIVRLTTGCFGSGMAFILSLGPSSSGPKARVLAAKRLGRARHLAPVCWPIARLEAQARKKSSSAVSARTLCGSA